MLPMGLLYARLVQGLELAVSVGEAADQAYGLQYLWARGSICPQCGIELEDPEEETLPLA